MNIKKVLTLIGLIFVANFVFAIGSQLKLTSNNNQNLINITLNIANFESINNLEFHGLEDVLILNRQVLLSTSSQNKQNNQIKITLSLMPTKPQTLLVCASADVNGKNLKSNPVKLIVTKEQIKKYQDEHKKQAKLGQEKFKEMQENINKQFEAQKKIFDNFNSMMQKQLEEMYKSAKKSFKNLEDAVHK